MVGRHAVIASLAAMSVLLASPSSHADEDGGRSAQQFFERGLKMRDDGKCKVIPVGDAAKCRESIDAFRHAYALNPSGLGALRNLAYVERSLGLVTSAARDFHELARKAPLDPKPERRAWATFAAEEATALEPRTPHLVVKVPRDRPPDLKVYLDEELLSESIWGASVDVDPGAHSIRTESVTVPTFAVSIDLAERESRTIDVIFPVSTIVQPAVSVVPLDPVAPQPVVVEAPVERPLPLAKKTNLPPIYVSAAGGAVLTAGIVVAVVASNKYDSSCPVLTSTCDANGVSKAQTFSTVSTVMLIVGGAASIGGLAWFFVWPTLDTPRSTKPHAIRSSPYFNGQSAGFAGTF